MQETARLRDHLYFAADATAAQALGVSRMSVQRYKREIEREPGLVVRTQGPFRKTVCYRILRRPVTQRTSCQPKTSRAVCGPRYVRGPRCSGRAASGRRRKLVEKHPEKITDQGVVRANGAVTPFNAGDAVAAAVNVCQADGIPLAPSIRARMGKGAKALLESNFPPAVVVSACVVAIRTGWFGSVESIGQEIAVAKAGKRIRRDQYQQALDQTAFHMATSDSAVWAAVRQGNALHEGRTS